MDATGFLTRIAKAMPSPNTSRREEAFAAYGQALRHDLPGIAMTADLADNIGASLETFPTWDELAPAIRAHMPLAPTQDRTNPFVATFRRRLAELGPNRLPFLLGIARHYPPDAWTQIDQEFGERHSPATPEQRAAVRHWLAEATKRGKGFLILRNPETPPETATALPPRPSHLHGASLATARAQVAR